MVPAIACSTPRPFAPVRLRLLALRACEYAHLIGPVGPSTQTCPAPVNCRSCATADRITDACNGGHRYRRDHSRPRRNAHALKDHQTSCIPIPPGWPGSERPKRRTGVLE